MVSTLAVFIGMTLVGARPLGAQQPPVPSEVGDDDLIIIEDDDPIIIEGDDSIIIEGGEPPSPPPTQATPWRADFLAVNGALLSRGGVSYGLPAGGDPWRGFAEGRFAIELRPNSMWRAHIDAWARGLGRAALPRFPWDSSSAVDRQTFTSIGSAELGEAYLRLNVPKGSLTVGRQIFSWSRSELTRLGDLVNPVDTRAGLLFPEGYAGRLPVLSVAGRLLLGGVAFNAVWLPVFEPPRVRFFASDLEAVSPGSPPPALAPSPAALGEAALSRPFGDLRETMAAPRGGLDTGELALRASGTAAGVDLGAQIFAGHDRVAMLHMRPAMAAALGLANDGLSSLAAASSLRRLCPAPDRSGGCVPLSDLVELEYERSLFGVLDGATTLGPTVLKAELAAAPRIGWLPGGIAHLIDTRTRSLISDRVSTLATAISLESGYGEWINGALEVVDVAYLNVPNGHRVARVEPASVQADGERTVHRIAMSLALSGALFDRDLRWRCAAMASPLQRDYVVAPRVAYRAWLGQELAMGAELLGGPAGTFGGFFEAASRLYLEWKLEF